MFSEKKDLSLIDRYLNRIERTGNKLPHPVILFFILSFAVLILS
jgi:aminobenzoyl-glutamate transport protein